MTYRKEWVEEATHVQKFFDVCCDGCDKALSPAFPDGWNNLFSDEGIVVTLRGNYPSKWDDLNEMFVLCDHCVDTLALHFPRIGERLHQWRTSPR